MQWSQFAKLAEMRHRLTRGYSILEVALAMPAVIVLVVVVTYTLHVCAHLIVDWINPSVTAQRSVSGVLAIRRTLQECLVVTDDGLGGVALYGRSGRPIDIASFLGGRVKGLSWTWDHDAAFASGEHRPTAIVLSTRLGSAGTLHEVDFVVRAATGIEAEFFRAYGQETRP